MDTSREGNSDIHFDFEVVHKPGEFCKEPVALSRLPTIKVNEADKDDDNPTWASDNDDQSQTAFTILRMKLDSNLSLLRIVDGANDAPDVVHVPNTGVCMREQKKNALIVTWTRKLHEQ